MRSLRTAETGQSQTGAQHPAFGSRARRVRPRARARVPVREPPAGEGPPRSRAALPALARLGVRDAGVTLAAVALAGGRAVHEQDQGGAGGSVSFTRRDVCRRGGGAAAALRPVHCQCNASAPAGSAGEQLGSSKTGRAGSRSVAACPAGRAPLVQLPYGTKGKRRSGRGGVPYARHRGTAALRHRAALVRHGNKWSECLSGLATRRARGGDRNRTRNRNTLTKRPPSARGVIAPLLWSRAGPGCARLGTRGPARHAL